MLLDGKEHSGSYEIHACILAGTVANSRCLGKTPVTKITM